MPRPLAWLRIIFAVRNDPMNRGTMKKLWNDLLNEPVVAFTVLSAGMVAANAEVTAGWFNVATVVVVAVGGAVTRHYVKPTRKL